MRAILFAVVIAAGCNADSPTDNLPPPGHGELAGQAPPTAPADRVEAPRLDEAPGREVPAAPTTATATATAALLPVTAAPTTITDWSRRAVAVAVIRVDAAQAFETAAPPFVSTRFALSVVRAIDGTAPATAVLPGGSLPSTTVLASGGPRLEVGKTYLGFFWPDGALVFAPAMADAEHTVVDGRRVALDEVPALIRAARAAGTGGAS